MENSLDRENHGKRREQKPHFAHIAVPTVISDNEAKSQIRSTRSHSSLSANWFKSMRLTGIRCEAQIPEGSNPIPY